MSDFKKLLSEARLPERTVTVCLRGDLVAEFEHLERELQQAQQAALTSMEDSAGTAIAERIEDLRAEMRDHTYTFRIRALPKPEYRQVKALHPPRRHDDGDVLPEDALLDANLDTFGEALVRRGLVDPELDDTDWADLVSKLTDRQYGDLIGTAISVNKGGVDVPFSRAASNLLQSSGHE